jgi:hypothetical protein
MTGLSVRHVARSSRFNRWRIRSGKHHRFKTHPALFMECEELLRRKWQAVGLRRWEGKPVKRHGPISKRELVLGAVFELACVSAVNTDWSNDFSKALFAAKTENYSKMIGDLVHETNTARSENRRSRDVLKEWMADSEAWLFQKESRLPITSAREVLDRIKKLRGEGDDVS